MQERVSDVEQDSAGLLIAPAHTHTHTMPSRHTRSRQPRRPWRSSLALAAAVLVVALTSPTATATATTNALEPPSNKSLFSSDDSEPAHNHGFRVGLRKAKTFGSHAAVGAGAANGAGVHARAAAAAARKGAHRRQALDIEVIGDLLGVQVDADGQPAVVTVGLEEIFAVDPNNDGVVTSGSVLRTETAVVTYTTRINEDETSEWRGDTREKTRETQKRLE